jgi:STE24 endopeptidase
MPAIIATVMLATAFLSMPILLRLFLGLKPLPAGRLRERLENTARRLRFGYSNVLVWHTRNLFANAMVTGFIPWLRYIVLTDRLIDELTPDEVEAVFGHEVGHIKHHHLFFYLAFFLTSFILLTLFWEQLKGWIRLDDVVAALGAVPSFDSEDFKDTLKTLSSFVKLGLLAAYTLLFFGFISRRCERQADLFGARTVSTDVFISALEKVADINGIPRRRSGNWLLSWQHPTIAQRVEFLQQMRDNPARIPRFHLSIMLMQGSLYTGLGFLLWVLWKLELLDLWKLLAEF